MYAAIRHVEGAGELKRANTHPTTWRLVVAGAGLGGDLALDTFHPTYNK
jgi:hypothetical protein